MILLIYAGKTILISSLLYGYYWLFLRNKQFHQYNRFFLIGIPCIALILPLINIPIPWLDWQGAGNGATRLLQVTRGQWEDPVIISPNSHMLANKFNMANGLLVIYFAFVLALLSVFLRSAKYIRRISKAYPYQIMEGVRFYETDEKGSPFSFFNLVFWNRALDFQSQKGQQILRHELYHVQQRHSIDIVLLEFLKIFFWFNPFFHLIRKEINAIHEFLADQYAISGRNRYAYAEILLLSSMQADHPQISNPFFHNQIKRRIAMITKNNSLQKNYLSRLMILPVLLFLSIVFAFRFIPNQGFSSSKTIKVIVDAGHGGSDLGAIAVNGADEKSINLQIAQKIKSLSKDYPIEVVLTRESDELAGKTTDIHQSLKYRAALASNLHADLFISIHVNADLKDPAANGFDVYVSDENTNPKSILLGTLISESLGKEYTVSNDLKKSERVLVLHDNTVPAVLVECGYLTNSKDRAMISDEQNQEKIARDILAGILKYSQTNSASRAGNGPPQPQDPSEKKPTTTSSKQVEVIGRIFTKVEVEAEYPGGQEAWTKYLIKNIVYPPKAMKYGLMGDVIVEFVVSKTGELSQVKAVFGPEELRAESVRIIRQSGHWIPAKEKGVAVDSYKKQPIKYRLQ
ncbi:MAG: N-acetylmuramoyl-L-alanine amidase [Chitinophagales bacterium]